jgi:DNA-binding MarR family transcriptional regulator
MTKTSNGPSAGPERTGAPPGVPSVEDIALERALEGLFRLGANRRFEARQSAVVGAVVTRAGYAVLRSLSDLGPSSQRLVADACAMDGATASRQVMALVEEGLVQRRTADGDGRSVELSLTDHGREVYERIVRYRLGHLANVLADWPEAERAVLARLVGRFTEDLGSTPVPR